MSDGLMVYRQCEKTTQTLPLLKWPGGKRALIKHIVPLLPQNFNRYFEPFMGGGALYFALQPKEALLADCNAELINCYQQVKDFPNEVIMKLNTCENSKENYYKIRSFQPSNDLDKAVRFIYLTSLSFNGIYRTNMRGEFNVPYGYKTHLNPCDPERIKNSSAALKAASLHCCDFGDVLSHATDGDLVYLDPPYTVAHKNNGFIKYNAKIFSWEDQVRLSLLARDLVKRNCYVLVSNADHPSIRQLYSDFSIKTVERSSVIAAANKFRKNITECIFFNGGKND